MTITYNSKRLAMIKIAMRLCCLTIFALLTLNSCAQLKPKVVALESTAMFGQVTSPVSDYEKLFTENERMTLLNVLTDFEENTGIRIAVITVNTDMVVKAKFDDHIALLADQWNLKNQKRKAGILIGISQGHRLIRINNNAAVQELITDLETELIMNEFFIENFKTKHYYRGSIEGVQALMKLLRVKLKNKS